MIAADVDPMDLSSSGWGIILPRGAPPAVRDALLPLLHHRREQATQKNEKYYRELEYTPGESKEQFLRRYEVEAGPAHPKQLPYYLLIIGGPDVVPYRFQYLLDMQYAVGRLYFDDSEDYRRYAESVVAAEHGQHHVRAEASFFSVRTPSDGATRISEERFVRPLIESIRTRLPEWPLRLFSGDQADKGTLGRLIGGGETPALLVTAAHGLGFVRDHSLQQEHQGGIICKEWPGRKRPVKDHHYFSATDVSAGARVHGLIAFLFGCYSAGTPAEDNFPPSSAWGQPIEPPSKPFMSGLARRLLSHPNGSALAVVGHVDRAWSCSLGNGRGNGILHFESFFQQLLQGSRIGLAMDCLNLRFAELATGLVDVLDKYQESRFSLNQDEYIMNDLWRATNDARNFILLGDPAIRLATGPRIGKRPPRAEHRGLAGEASCIRPLAPVTARQESAHGCRKLRGDDSPSRSAGSDSALARAEGKEGKVVVDASVILAILLRTPPADKIADRLRKAQGNIHAPHLLDFEVTQVLRCHAISHPSQADRCRQAFVDLQEMPIFRYSFDALSDRIWELSQEFTVSDATYLALAERLSAPLVTCDARLRAPGHGAEIEVVSS